MEKPERLGTKNNHFRDRVEKLGGTFNEPSPRTLETADEKRCARSSSPLPPPTSAFAKASADKDEEEREKTAVGSVGSRREFRSWNFAAALASVGLSCALLPRAQATENVPHRPFALWAELPAPGQFVTGIVYEESEAYHIYVQGISHNITYHVAGESYGIDVNQGYVALQYGITDKLAADLNGGGTTSGWRYFSNGTIESVTGLMDWSFGLRYQIFNEYTATSPWVPTLTLRAGGILPGTYNSDFAFAPGTHSTGLEPEVLLRKHFGWPGLGAYGDALYRWNFTTGNDQYITVIGLFQQIKRWELDVGYRHLQSVSGSDITFDPTDPTSLVYPRDVREINDSIEAGFSYTTSKRHFRYGFHSRTVFDGNNSDRKFWVGGSLDIPFGGK